MFQFLFGPKKGAPKVETQRETFERLVTELNALLATLPEKPKVTVDPMTGSVEFSTPEQFADEALALPAPEEPADTKEAPEEPEADKADKADSADAPPKAA